MSSITHQIVEWEGWYCLGSESNLIIYVVFYPLSYVTLILFGLDNALIISILSTRALFRLWCTFCESSKSIQFAFYIPERAYLPSNMILKQALSLPFRVYEGIHIWGEEVQMINHLICCFVERFEMWCGLWDSHMFCAKIHVIRTVGTRPSHMG